MVLFFLKLFSSHVYCIERDLFVDFRLRLSLKRFYIFASDSKCRNSLLGDDNNWDYDESEKSRAAACRLKPAKWVDMDDAASETLADVLKTNKKGSIDSFHSATSVDTWADGEGRRRPIMVDRTPLLISHSADDLYQVFSLI